MVKENGENTFVWIHEDSGEEYDMPLSEMFELQIEQENDIRESAGSDIYTKEEINEFNTRQRLLFIESRGFRKLLKGRDIDD